jgi:uncharacterized circularly permuted ATP-grasp superfamily protein/uncharacterized alpha-E superfamily protein
METQVTEPAAAQTPPRPRGLAEIYSPQFPARDEMVEPDGALRAHWRPFVSMLDDLGREEVLSRWDRARRLIRENGINHNIYDDPDGHARPWSLDLLPMLLTSAEWAGVSYALSQRARLMNALLADLYGRATSLLSGILPPELVYANPGFLRPCNRVEPQQGQWIHLYAADLVRAPDGQFQVLADRTQAPSGAGYCLENRIVLTRVLPTVFGQCNVLRLAPFFISLRQTLAALAPANRENPRVVLLTPGPYNETYFEHAYLARYLGYALVQGKDLTVRDCKVYLKTLSGLQRVDVILRRVDDDFCDPLELYPHSFLGVAGLLQAVREKNVAVANALGSGVAQGTALLPFLPALCRQLLGEDLKLHSVQTWWCGEPASLKYVLENLARLVIKPALPTRGSDPLFGDELSRADLEELAGKIRARPTQYVAQEKVDSYVAPVFLNGAAQSRRFVVRAYLAATGNDFTVMPGGLTRVTGSPQSQIVSLQKGGGSKDTWVLGDGPVSAVSLLPSATAPVTLSRAGSDLPSRAADDLFWLGRYVQRAELLARLSRFVFNRLSDLNSAQGPLAMQVLMRELVNRRAPQSGPEAGRLLAAEMFGDADPSGIRGSVKRFHSLARVLRDRISSDAWRILQSIHRDVSDFDGRIDDDHATVVVELTNRLVTGFLAFGGMVSESMTRGLSWRFLDMGMRIERGVGAARLIRSTLIDDIGETGEQSFLLDAILDVADSVLTYRRRYLTQLDVTAVVDLLIADETNPRAVAFQMAAIDEHLSHLPRESNHPQRSPDHQIAIRLKTLLRLTDLSVACRVTQGRRGRLNALVTSVVEDLTAVSDLVSQIFFSHATISPRLLSPDQERTS